MTDPKLLKLYTLRQQWSEAGAEVAAAKSRVLRDRAKDRQLMLAEKIVKLYESYMSSLP